MSGVMPVQRSMVDDVAQLKAQVAKVCGVNLVAVSGFWTALFFDSHQLTGHRPGSNCNA